MNATARVTLSLIVVGVLLGIGEMARGVAVTWDGSDSTDWTLDGNWAGGVAPANNLTTDYAVFTGGVTANLPSVGAARSVGGVQFFSAGWTLDGPGPLSLGTIAGRDSSAIWLRASGTVTVNCDLSMTGGGRVLADVAGGMVILNGVVSGPFTTHWDADNGTVRLAGSSSNSITSFSMNQGTLELAKTGGAKALNMAAGEFGSSGGTVRWLEDNQFTNANTIKNTGGLTLDLNGHTDTLGRIYGNGRLAITLGGGTLSFAGSASDPVIWNHWDGVPSVTQTVSGPGTINLTTSGDFNPGNTPDTSGIDLDISAFITAGPAVPSVSFGLLREPRSSIWGVTRLSSATGNTYVKDTEVARTATLVVANTSGSATGTGNVYVGNTSASALNSILAGNGILVPGAGNAVYVQNKGALSPGFGPTDAEKIDTLTVDGDVVFQAGSFFDVEHDGTGSDLLAVSGALDISGATLNLTDLGGGETAPLYILATYGSLTGTFAAINGTIPPGMELVYDGGSIRLMAPIPEPATLALLGLGLAGLRPRRRPRAQ
ncbi:MAG: hypothetical protein BWZ02_00517 [Lentisphaerae bacterium ADurb.BinA184]|nr:MAG: hypothetical protein BWZ02_00517 [Lentisphaerae bacterium ADurb.BinA184]